MAKEILKFVKSALALIMQDFQKILVLILLLVDSLEGTMIQKYDPIACPQMIVQLYTGLMKVYKKLKLMCMKAAQRLLSTRTKIRLQG
jgi:hypothetical protein